MKQYVLISGASSGVGKEVAIQLSKTYALVINGRNLNKLEQTRKQCSCSENVIIWQYDLMDVENIEEELNILIKEKKIQVCGFVHCAGIMKLLPCKVFSYVSFDEVFRVNVYSAAMIVKVLTSKKINSKKLTKVVFVSSNVSIRGTRSFGVYGSSKSALDGLMRNLAVELAPNVRVNSVLPGGMVTEMTKDLFFNKQVRENFDRTYPLGIGSPKKVCSVIEFLLSDQANWITGQQIVVDGGRTIDITEKNNI